MRVDRCASCVRMILRRVPRLRLYLSCAASNKCVPAEECRVFFPCFHAVRPFGGGRVLFRHDAICRFGRSDLPRPTAKRSTRMSLSRWRQELLSNYFGSNELVNSHSPLQASCCRCGCSRLHSLAPRLGVLPVRFRVERVASTLSGGGRARSLGRLVCQGRSHMRLRLRQDPGVPEQSVRSVKALPRPSRIGTRLHPSD